MRYAFTTTVKDGKMEEYLHYHDHIWPEVCRGSRRRRDAAHDLPRAADDDALPRRTTAGATDLGEATGPRRLPRGPVGEGKPGRGLPRRLDRARRGPPSDRAWSGRVRGFLRFAPRRAPRLENFLRRFFL